jgi:putative GTP pyrophosphokinase
MLPLERITELERNAIEELVAVFAAHEEGFLRVVKLAHSDLSEHRLLREVIHSSKYRLKEPSHLADKLARKILRCREEKRDFDITAANLFERIGDLVGVRLLHLHTDQMEKIDPAIREILEEFKYSLVEGPVANTWDDEYKTYFEGIGIKTVSRDSMYTSVHYVIEPSQKMKVRCELQVRTLMEEVWGEVSHKINYPSPTESVACREQLKVLARVASGGTRLVDSIFSSHKEHEDRQLLARDSSTEKPATPKPSPPLS